MSQAVNLQSLVLDLSGAWKEEDVLSCLGKINPQAQMLLEQELSPNIQSSFVRPSELVPCFSSLHSVRTSQEVLRNLLGASLYYCFSDGKVVEWNHILFHPNAKHMHPDLLPLRKGIYDNEFKHQDLLWTRPDQKVILEYGEVEYLLLRILKNIQKMIANKRLSLFVRTKAEPEVPKEIQFVRYDEDFQCAKTGKIHFMTELTSDVGSLNIQIKMQEKEGCEFYKNLYLEKEEGLLIFHGLGGFFNSLESKLLEEKVMKPEDLDQQQIQIKSSSLNFSVESPDKALRILKLVREDLAEKYYLNVAFDHEIVSYSQEQYQPRIYFTKDARFSVSFSFQLEEESFEVFNLPKDLESLAVGFEKGFGGVFDRLGWKVPLKGIRRIRDSKLLKHTGVYGYFLYEILSQALLGKCLDERNRENKEEFKEYLQENLAKYFQLGEGGVDSSKFALLFSRGVVENLDKLQALVEEYLAKDLRVLIQGKESIFEGMYRHYLLLFFEVLKTIAQVSNLDCFVRSRTNYSLFHSDLLPEEGVENQGVGASWDLMILTEKNLSQVDRYSLESKGLKRPLQISELFTLNQFSWQFFVDGVAVDIIDESKFRWEFELEEKSQMDAAPEAVQGRQRMDWFELHPKFFLQGEEIGFEQARKLSQGEWIQFKGRYFILKNHNIPSVKVLEKFWQKIANKKIQTGVKDEAKAYYELDRNASLELLALRSLGVAIKGGPEWQAIVDFFDGLHEEKDAEYISSALKEKLKSYQKKGLHWIQALYQLRMGGILADDMGLGKTLQALGFLEELRLENKLGRSLILVPTSLVYNWMAECQKFTPEMEMISFSSKEKDIIEAALLEKENLVLVSTYGLFTEHEEFFQKFSWNVHIYDEAQNLKNLLTKRTTAVRKLDARFKLCLTGTPLENHMGEFFSLLDLSVPGSLGSYEDFKKTYVNPINIDMDDIRYLKLRVKPLVLRRTKKEILTELPEKTISVLKIPFSEEQKKIYRDVALSWNEKVKASIEEVGEARSQMIMLTALLRLRQVCSDPGALPGVTYKETPPKVQLLTDSLESIVDSGESAIVFTQFIHSLERISSTLHQRGVKVFSMDGRSSKVKREQCLRDFENCETGSVLLMTLKTGGVGLNLTKASYVFHLEPWWNPAVEDQATDRVHRLGQKNAVQVYRYIMEESVEEKIELLKEKKASYFQQLFSVESNSTEEVQVQNSSGLTREDFEFLLS